MARGSNVVGVIDLKLRHKVETLNGSYSMEVWWNDDSDRTSVLMVTKESWRDGTSARAAIALDVDEVTDLCDVLRSWVHEVNARKL